MTLKTRTIQAEKHLVIKSYTSKLNICCATKTLETRKQNIQLSHTDK